MNALRTLLTLVASSLLICVSYRDARCQSTIVNVPSTDVVAAEKIYLEMDFITNYAWQRDAAKFANYLPRAVVGVGHNVEVGANFSYTRVPGGGAPIELQPNAKWKFYQDEAKGLAASVGCIWFLPLTHRAVSDTLGECYSVLSEKFRTTRGPRFTGGGYVLIGAGNGQPTKAGAIAGYEQRVTKRIGLIMDWASGDNRIGYVSPALDVTIPHNGSVTAGYAIANRGRGRNALFIFYGRQF